MPELDINLDDVSPAEPFEPIPAGWYKVIVDESEWKETRDGSGRYLRLTLTVLCDAAGESTYENRKVWHNLNLKNANQKTVEIAKRQLKALAEACGKPSARNSEELHNIPVEAKISVRPALGEYEASNDVKGYRPVGGVKPAAAKAAPAPRSVPHAGVQSAPPGVQSAPPAGVPWGQQKG